MSRNVICVSPDQTLEEYMVLMTEEHIRHLPVVENDKVISIITIRRCGTSNNKGSEIYIEELRKYIIGE